MKASLTLKCYKNKENFLTFMEILSIIYYMMYMIKKMGLYFGILPIKIRNFACCLKKTF